MWHVGRKRLLIFLELMLHLRLEQKPGMLHLQLRLQGVTDGMKLRGVSSFTFEMVILGLQLRVSVESVRDGMTPAGMTPGWGAETPRDTRVAEDVKVYINDIEVKNFFCFIFSKFGMLRLRRRQENQNEDQDGI